MDSRDDFQNMAESEVVFWSAGVEVILEDFVFDKSWTTGSVDCLPSSLLPVGTEIKVNSVSKTCQVHAFGHLKFSNHLQ